MTATVEGLDQLHATIDQACDRLADLTPPTAEMGQAIEVASHAAAPVRTGELVASFGVTVDAASVTVTNTAGHAIPVQFGTRYMDAQPFMPDPAAVAVPIYSEYLNQVLADIHGK